MPVARHPPSLRVGEACVDFVFFLWHNMSGKLATNYTQATGNKFPSLHFTSTPAFVRTRYVTYPALLSVAATFVTMYTLLYVRQRIFTSKEF
jgi:hypothetical protein